jgi:predicted N-acyltransferase
MFIKRPIPWLIGGVQYYDAITPYGYGGPLVLHSSDAKGLIAEFTVAWRDYCANENIICEFVRFHLFDNVDIRENYYGVAAHMSDNVVVNTAVAPDTIATTFKPKVRKNIKKAVRSGLTVECDETGRRLEEFLRVYYNTMDRNNASAYYYFSEKYFHDICDQLQGNRVFFHVLHENNVISTELVLCSDDYAYSFLGGTDNAFYDFRPNDLLKYEVIQWCFSTGRKKYILGGGYRKDDGIYRYKKAFSSDADTPFYVGKAVHNREIYQQSVALREKEGDFDPNSSFFPLYRS